MRSSERKTIGLRLAVFATLLLVGGWPWESVARVFSAGYCPIVDRLVLSRVTFGAGGHAHIEPLDRLTVQEGDNVVADTRLSLTVDRFGGEVNLGMSLRRDAYLPLLILTVFVMVAPLGGRRKAVAWLAGVVVVFLASVACLAFMITWTFSTQMERVYQLSDGARTLIEFAFRALLLPPANRVVGPIVVGLAMILWQRRRAALLGGARG